MRRRLAAADHGCCDGVERADLGVPLVGGSDDGCDIARGNNGNACRAALEADEVGQEVCREGVAAAGEDHGAGRADACDAACGPQGGGGSDGDDGFAVKKESEGFRVIRCAEVDGAKGGEGRVEVVGGGEDAAVLLGVTIRQGGEQAEGVLPGAADADGVQEDAVQGRVGAWGRLHGGPHGGIQRGGWGG